MLVFHTGGFFSFILASWKNLFINTLFYFIYCTFSAPFTQVFNMFSRQGLLGSLFCVCKMKGDLFGCWADLPFLFTFLQTPFGTGWCRWWKGLLSYWLSCLLIFVLGYVSIAKARILISPSLYPFWCVSGISYSLSLCFSIPPFHFLPDSSLLVFLWSHWMPLFVFWQTPLFLCDIWTKRMMYLHHSSPMAQHNTIFPCIWSTKWDTMVFIKYFYFPLELKKTIKV